MAESIPAHLKRGLLLRLLDEIEEPAAQDMSKSPGVSSKTQMTSRTDRPLKSVSLFCSGGIADLALREIGIEVVVASELLPERAALYRTNFPEAQVFEGDIRETLPLVCAAAREFGEIDILMGTPPCQGMSKNGRGKLLQAVRAGDKPKLDPRNQLIIQTVEAIKSIRPKLVILENVPEMVDTLIEVDGELLLILDYVRRELSAEYALDHEVVEFADYGVPQRRQRLITVLSRTPEVQAMVRAKAWLRPPTHSKGGSLLTKKWVSVEEAIGHMPPLDAKTKLAATSDIEHHSVPLLDESKYFWVSNTPPGRGAFDNQCVNPECLFRGNPTHGNARDEKGINQASKSTPIRCVQCGELLPRPWMEKDGTYRLMSGFTSAYKRMRADLPASALTRNLSYACSDQKIHPTQNRVLSIKEALIIHTIDKYEYRWVLPSGKRVSDKTIREVIGESVPPAGLEAIAAPLVEAIRQKRLAA